MIATLTVKANNIIGFINPVIADTVRLIRPGFTVILNADAEGVVHTFNENYIKYS